jgi:hypothetical protein
MATLFWEGVGSFLVRNGNEIVVEPAATVTEQVLRLFLLGPALGVLVQQRGLLALHASAVVVGAGVVAFLGDSGWGKSTTAAALHARGHQVVADDVVALDIDTPGRLMALPAFPRLKLGVAPAAALGYDVEMLTVFHPQDKRREYRVTKGFQEKPLPLERIYILADSEREEIEQLRPKEAFVELVRHSYAIQMLRSVGGSSAHFRQCVRVAESTPIYCLKRPRDLTALPGLARMVEEHSLAKPDR